MMTRGFATVGLVTLLAAWPAAADEKPAAPANTLTQQEKKDGWRLLFDGKSLDGWRRYNKKDADGWAAKDGAIFQQTPRAGDLITAEQFGDFEFSIDWKFEKGNNSGIIYRLVEGKGPSHNTGPEMQVMTHKPGTKLGKTSGGSLYDMYAPTSNPLRGPGEWNTFKIVCRGKHIEHWVNGVQVVDCDVGSDDWNRRYAASKWKNLKQFAAASRGHIALQDHGGKVLFRNIKVRTLEAK